jgi:hypothetical protein
MSDENKFFRWIWRFNGVVLALLCFVTVAAIGYNVTSGWFRNYGENPEGHFVPVPKDAEANNTYRLNSSGSIGFLKEDGSQEIDLVFTLGDWNGAPNVYGLQSVGSSGSRYRGPYYANILLENAETGAGRWLFQGYGRNILSWDTVVDPAKKDQAILASAEPVVVAAGGVHGDTNSVRVLVLKVIDKDTDGDGELTDKDRLTLYTWHLVDKAPEKLLDADLILSQSQIGADRYVITYETGRAAFIAVYSVPDFKLLTKKPLPKLPG